MLIQPAFNKPTRPIFIIGAPRSGTSVTTWALGQLPNVQPMPETTWIATLAAGGFVAHAYGAARGQYSHLSNVYYPPRHFLRRLGEAVDAIVNDCFQERCYLYYEHENAHYADMPDAPFQVRRNPGDPKRRWIDGTPLNTFFLWALAMMFPEARFIHNLRRPGDVATSLEGFDKLGQAAVELEEGLRSWSRHTEAAVLGERAFGPDKVFRLHFDRLADDPEQLLRDLCGFLGEDYSDDCLIPLRHRINSSDVDERRAGNLERLRTLEAYRACESLYDEIVARPVAGDGDPASLERLREQFVEYCRQHPLL